MSHRTQITLRDDQYDRLRKEAEASGVSLSELIRRAIDSGHDEPSLEQRLGALEASFGAWAEPPGEDRAAYLKELRGRGVGERLAEREALERAS